MLFQLQSLETETSYLSHRPDTETKINNLTSLYTSKYMSIFSKMLNCSFKFSSLGNQLKFSDLTSRENKRKLSF